MTAEQSKKSVELMDLLAEILAVQDKVESVSREKGMCDLMTRSINYCCTLVKQGHKQA